MAWVHEDGKNESEVMSECGQKEDSRGKDANIQGVSITLDIQRSLKIQRNERAEDPGIIERDVQMCIQPRFLNLSELSLFTPHPWSTAKFERWTHQTHSNTNSNRDEH